MFLSITWTAPLVIAATGLSAYILIALFLKTRQVLSQTKYARLTETRPTTLASRDLLPLIERPFNSIVSGPDELHEPDLTQEGWEFVDDKDNILLIEAEKVVEKIQHTIDHIASKPPNPQEVYSKLNAVVREYSIFENTEYFDAINSFVSVCVERDCNIKYSQEELLALWN